MSCSWSSFSPPLSNVVACRPSAVENPPPSTSADRRKRTFAATIEQEAVQSPSPLRCTKESICDHRFPSGRDAASGNSGNTAPAMMAHSSGTRDINRWAFSSQSALGIASSSRNATHSPFVSEIPLLRARETPGSSMRTSSTAGRPPTNRSRARRCSSREPLSITFTSVGLSSNWGSSAVRQSPTSSARLCVQITMDRSFPLPRDESIIYQPGRDLYIAKMPSARAPKTRSRSRMAGPGRHPICPTLWAAARTDRIQRLMMTGCKG
jgi:hypothetical protein